MNMRRGRWGCRAEPYINIYIYIHIHAYIIYHISIVAVGYETAFSIIFLPKITKE